MAGVTPAPDTVDLYFDFASPYAYFAHRALGELAARHGLLLRRRPVLLWAVLKDLGMPPPMQQPAKKQYLERDMRRSAEFFGLPFSLPPRFPVSSHAPARVYYAIEAQWPGQCGEFTERVFRAYFTEGRDIADAAVLAGIAAGLGVPAEAVHQAVAAESCKAALRQANDEAASRGVWGSPYWFWGEEAFFGADRVAQFEHLLNR